MAYKSLKPKDSLERVVNRAILFGMFVLLGLSTLIVHLIVIFPSMGTYKRELRHEGEIATQLIGEQYILDTIKWVKELYYSTPEEIRADEFSDEYKQLIIPYIDEEFLAKRNVLSLIRERAQIDNIAYVFMDERAKRLVFVMDGNDPDSAYLPAQWVSDDNGDIEKPATIEKAMKSDWFMPVAYGKTSGWVGTDYRGIYDEYGKLVGYIAVNVPLDKLANEIWTIIGIYIPLMLLVILWCSNRTAKRMKMRVVRPLDELTASARRYKDIGDHGEGGEYRSVFEDLALNTGDEIEELWKTMVDMEKEIEASFLQIRKDAATRERIATELELARNIQSGALPVNFESFPGNDRFKLFATMVPARDVGGDFYDFFRIDETHIGLVIADVSDKGIPAALFMMTSKSLLRSNCIPGRTPAQVLSITNDSLCADNPSSMFLTAWLGIVDTETFTVTAANAGHEFPFITGIDGCFELFEEPHGVVLGCLEGMEYEDYSFTIPEGGMLYVYTDGVAEAQDEGGELFGLDRIGRVLNRFKDMQPRELIESMKDELDEFKQSADQFDDITMLAIRRL